MIAGRLGLIRPRFPEGAAITAIYGRSDSEMFNA